MNTELVNVSPTRKEIKIEIDQSTVRKTYDRISDQYAKQATIPGFRPGHAPRAVVRTRYKNEIRAQALKELLPPVVGDAITKHELNTVGEPNVELDNDEALNKFGEEPLSVKVNVEVFPEIELHDYKGLAVSQRIRPVTDESIDQMIDALRESSASMQPVEDRAAELGDTVTANVVGRFVDDPTQEEIKRDETEVILGGKNVQPEFTENLLGVKPDDERVFTVNYPENYRTKDFAGKKVEYTAKVTAVRVKELPELDDEWAKSLGEDLDSVAALRSKVKEDMEAQAKQEAQHRVRAEVMERLLENHKFEVPQTLVDHQVDYRLQTLVREMMQHGVDPRSQEVNWEGARDEMKQQAEADVRGSLLLERIAEEEKIEVSDEEIESEIETIARHARQPIEQVRSVLTKDGGERSIAGRLRNRKTLDLLVANAKVTDEEWREEQKSEEEQTSEIRSQNSE
jgi:trigger factor